MKTKLIISILVLTLYSAGMEASALASSNKYEAYQTQVEGTNGTSAGAQDRKHGNKYCREKMERDGRGGTTLPSVSEAGQNSPKNYRNQN
ncbi:hypothetical protein K1X76_10775 [bacterium]|nr:hypothetical protein [bacterium]